MLAGMLMQGAWPPSPPDPLIPLAHLLQDRFGYRYELHPTWGSLSASLLLVAPSGQDTIVLAAEELPDTHLLAWLHAARAQRQARGLPSQAVLLVHRRPAAGLRRFAHAFSVQLCIADWRGSPWLAATALDRLARI
jgi:hypothetical protein